MLDFRFESTLRWLKCLPLAKHSMIIRLLILTSVLVTSGCFFNKPSSTVVNSGDSTPISEREDGIAWDGIRDRTAVVAYEVGRCESDDDCIPRGCDDAVCSPEGTELTCMTSRVGVCLAAIGRQGCLCNEGVCRWARTPRVMECAAIAVGRPGTRPFRGSEGEAYPNPPGY